MKKVVLALVCLSIFFGSGLKAQDWKKLDEKYRSIYRFVKSNKVLTKKIRRTKSKKALQFSVAEEMVNTYRIKYFKEELTAYNPDEFTPEYLKSLVKKKLTSGAFKQEARFFNEGATYTGYELHFSRVEGDLVLAELDGRDNVRILMVFVFNDKNDISRCFFKSYLANR